MKLPVRFTHKQIILLSLILAIAGLFVQLVAFFDILLLTAISPLTQVIQLFGIPSLFQNVFIYFNPHTHYSTDYWSMFFYVGLLTATLLYRTNNKNSTLLAFFYSLVFVCQFSGIFGLILSTPVHGYFYLAIIIRLIVSLLWMWLSCSIVQSLLPLNSPITAPPGSGYVKAKNGMRMVNYIIDGFIILWIGLPIVITGIHALLSSFLIILFFFALTYFAYYFACEFFMGTTPGKVLTATFIIRENGNPPQAVSIMSRSVARLIPFEPFSFFLGSGLHDTLSNTAAMHKKHESTNGGKLAVILFSLLLIAALPFGARKIYTDSKEKQKTTEALQKKQERLNGQIDHLSSDCFIHLRDMAGNSYYLRVTGHNGEYIRADIVQDNMDTLTLAGLCDMHRNKTIWPTTHFTTDELRTTITNNFTSEEDNNKFFDLKGYKLDNIYRLYEPSISVEQVSGFGKAWNHSCLVFTNKGWDCTITAIEDARNITFTDPGLPALFRGEAIGHRNRAYDRRVRIEGDYTPGRKYSYTLVLKSEGDGRLYKYRVTVENTAIEIRPVSS